MIADKEHNRISVAAWAKVMLSSNALILDTETTGLRNDEICQIAVISVDGARWLDTYVKPVRPIPADSTAIHGITDADVAGAPGWGEISDWLKAFLDSQQLVVYNAVYDRRMMHSAAEHARLPKVEWKEVCTWNCALLQYAKFYGEWNDYRGDWKWQTLVNACQQQNIPAPEAPAHSALGDCLRTLELLKVMAAWTDDLT